MRLLFRVRDFHISHTTGGHGYPKKGRIRGSQLSAGNPEAGHDAPVGNSSRPPGSAPCRPPERLGRLAEGA